MKSFNKLTKQEKKEYLSALFLLPFAHIWNSFKKAKFRILPRSVVAICLSILMIITILPIISTPASAASTLSFTMERNIYAIRASGSNDDTSRNNDNSRSPSTFVGLKSTRSGNTVTMSEEDGSGSNYRVTYDGYTIKVTVPAYCKYKVYYSVAVTLTKEKSTYANYKIAMAEVLTPSSASEVFTLNTNDSGTASSTYSIGKLSGSEKTFSKSGTYTFSRTFNNTTGSAKTYEAYVGFATAARLGAQGCFVTGTFTTSVTYDNITPGYTVKYNANGGSGSMSNQSFTRGQAKNLTSNAFTYTPKITYNENGGSAVSDASVAATFAGWEDRSTTSYGGTSYKYTDFDAAGYAIRNNDVFTSSAFGNSVYNKDAMLAHYVNHGKTEYANGSESRAPNTGYIYAYPNGAKVSNLTLTESGTVNLYAKWKYGTTTLPTPTKAGYTFTGWRGDLMDIASLTNGMEISNTARGTIGYNSGYAVTENLIPVVGGATYTSNYEVCGLYSFDANGNFIKRESSYATTHTVSPNAAFVRVEVNVAKGISFEEYQNNLTLTYTVPGGTSFPVGGNQTLTAQWSVNTYTITFDAQGGTTSLTTLPVIYGSNQNNKINTSTNPTKTDYIFDGWYTAPEGGTQIYKVSNGSCFQSDYWSKEYDVAGNGAVWQHAGNVTLYAHWIYAGTSIITFDAQGGTTSLTTLTATYGSNTNNRLDTTTNPTREGYIFEGWFDAPTGGTQIYKVSNGSCIASNYWTKSWEVAGTGATWKGPKELTLYAQWTIKTYTVIWKNYDGSVLETDTGVAYNSMPTYNGSTPTKAEDESFTYTFDSWSPDLSAVVGNVEYVATYTAASKRVDPTYTVTIPATAQVNDSFTVSAAGVVLNTDQTLTVTLQSDFTLRSAENASLSFVIDNGDVVNNTIVLSINGNGDTTQPISDSKTYAISLAETVRFAGRYTGNVTFTIAIESD